MGSPVVYFEISSRDCKNSKNFFKELFDWQITDPDGSDYGFVKDEGEGSIGGGIGPAENGNPSVTFYIHVDDLKKYLDKVESLGGKTVVAPTPIPGIGEYALFSDLDGNVLGIWKEK